MKKLVTSIIPFAMLLSFGAQAGTIQGISCMDNSIDFKAKASSFDNAFGNRIYVQISTSPSYRTYTKSQKFILTKNRGYSFDFKAMIKNSNQPGSYAISYFIFDSFGSIQKRGQCS